MLGQLPVIWACSIILLEWLSIINFIVWIWETLMKLYLSKHVDVLDVLKQHVFELSFKHNSFMEMC